MSWTNDDLFVKVGVKLNKDADIQAQLDALSKKVNFTIKPKLDNSVIKTQIENLKKQINDAFKNINANVSVNKSNKNNTTSDSSDSEAISRSVSGQKLSNKQLESLEKNISNVSKRYATLEDQINDTNRLTENLVVITSQYEKVVHSFTFDENGDPYLTQSKNVSNLGTAAQTCLSKIRVLNAEISNSKLSDEKKSVFTAQNNEISNYITKQAMANTLTANGLNEQLDKLKIISSYQKQEISETDRYYALCKRVSDVLNVEKEKHQTNLSYQKKMVKEQQVLEDLKSKNVDNMDSAQIRVINSDLEKLQKSITTTERNTKSFKEKFETAFSKFGQWLSVAALYAQATKAIKSMIDSVSKLDASLTELRKVTDLSETGLNSVTSAAYKTGKEVGRTGIEVLNAISIWARAGKDVPTAEYLAKYTLMFTNIADGIDDVKEASSSLISILNGFNMDDSSIENIIDVLNQISNTEPIDTSNLTEALETTSSVANQTGNDLEQTSAMITGIYSVLRNSSKTAVGLNYIMQQLSGVDEDGAAIDGLSASMQKAFDLVTKGQVKLTKQNGQLKSTYEIMDDLSESWDTMTTNQKNYLAQTVAGTRNSKSFIALMEQWDTVQNSYASALNSSGSAEEENAKYMESLQG